MASSRAVTPSPPSKAQDAGGRGGSAKRPSDASFANNKRQALSNRTNHVAPSVVISPSQDQTRKKTRGSGHTRSAKKRHGQPAATAACTRVTRSSSQQPSHAVARKPHTVVAVSASQFDHAQLQTQRPSQYQQQHQSDRNRGNSGRIPDLRDLPVSPRAIAAPGAAELAGASAAPGGAVSAQAHGGTWLRADGVTSCPGMLAVNGGGVAISGFHAAGSAQGFPFPQPQPQHRHSHDHPFAPAGEHRHWLAQAQAQTNLAEAALLSTEVSLGGSVERQQARYGELAGGFVSVPVANVLSHGHGPAHFTAHVALHSGAATDRSAGFSGNLVPVATATTAATAAATTALHRLPSFSAMPCAAMPVSSLTTSTMNADFPVGVPTTASLATFLPSCSSGGGSAGSVDCAGDVTGSAAEAQAQARAAAMDSINRKTERVLCISSVAPARDGERQGDGELTDGVRAEEGFVEERLAAGAHPSLSANCSSQWGQAAAEICGADGFAHGEALAQQAHGLADAQQQAGACAMGGDADLDAVGGAAKVRNIDMAHGDPQMCTAYAAEIYKNLRDGERRLRPGCTFLEGQGCEISASMRGILMDWLVEVAEEYKLVPDTLYLTASYIDRFLAATTVTRNHLQLLGISCMLIASKYEEIYAPQVDEFCYITDNTYRRNEVLDMERRVLSVLEFDLSTPTVKSFLRRFIKAAQAGLPSPQHHLEFLGNYFAELTLVDYSCLRFLPSQIAAAAVFLAKLTLYPSVKPWDSTLQHYTGYFPSHLKEAVVALYDLQRNVKGCTLPAIREKYRQPKFQAVALLPPPAELPDHLFLDL